MTEPVITRHAFDGVQPTERVAVVMSGIAR